MDCIGLHLFGVHIYMTLGIMNTDKSPYSYPTNIMKSEARGSWSRRL